MGGVVWRRRDGRALRGRDAPYGIGILCCGVSIIGFTASSYAQTVSPSTYGQPSLGGPPTAVGTALPAAGMTAILAPPGPEQATPGPIPPPILLIPSFELGEIFNDNVNLSPKGQANSDFITTVSPGFNLAVRGARTKLNLTYNPQELIFARGTSRNELQQRLQGAGRAEIVPEMIFFDANAAIDQEFTRNTGPIGTTTVTGSSNLSTVYSETASPYLLQHLGPYANSESRYRFSSTSTSGNQISSENIQEVLQRFSGGEFFGRLGWTVTGDWTLIQRGTDSTDVNAGVESKDVLARADFKYPVYEALSLIAGAGYEKITDSTLSNSPSGMVWSAGFQYQPNQKILYTLTYGRRFGKTDIELHSTHQITPQIKFHTLYSKVVQTSQSQIAANLSQLSPGQNGGFVNSQTGQPFVPNNTTSGTASSAFGLTSGSFLQTTSEADIEATRERDTYFATAYSTKQDGQASASVNSEKIKGGSISWTRQLWPDLSSSLGGAYNHDIFEDGSGRIDDFYSAFFRLGYTISQTSSANLSISRSDTESNIETNSVVNDVISVSLRKTF